MARIPENNRRYRSKDRICADVAKVLASRLHYGTKFAVLSEITWVWSEFHGKYEGCRYWSKKALAKKGSGTRFIHEHAVPKSQLIKLLLDEIKPFTPEKVQEILSVCCVGVVITLDEDRALNKKGLRSKMPKGWHYPDDVWARYKEVGIDPILCD